MNTTAGGRFEKEVSIISNIIDQVDNNSLIIMNEIFQSTSAEAGGDALFNILVYFTKKSTLWLTVTHLREICKRGKEFNDKTNKEFMVLSSSLVDHCYKITEYNPLK
jgi:DNA mismatch repair ATPase MutS